MSYTLGVDLGTTFTAAAICRDGRVEMVSLGNRAATIPSLVFLKDDESILVGDAAERRGMAEPERLAREFKRRLGDTTPILLARTPFSAERLMANVLALVVGIVAEREGERPAAVAVAHPANWGPYKTDLLRQAVEQAGLSTATLVTEPVAAAVHHASTERVDPGELLAVYDLGGGTFDAAVLRKTADGFETVGTPQGIERLGGIDVDEAVMAHVRAALGPAFAALDASDPAVRSAIARLHAECVAAKETLSTDSDTTIGVSLPGLQTEVRLTRPELESMVRPILRETVAALRRTIDSAGVAPGAIGSVLLVGGASRMPLVSELVAAELGRPVRLDAHPKHAVALGAARVAAQTASPSVASTSPVAAAASGAPASAGSSLPPPPPSTPVPAAAASVSAAGPSGGGRAGRGRTLVVVGVVAAVAAIGAIGAMAAFSGGDDSEASTDTTSGSTDSTAGGADTTVAGVTSVPTETTATPTTIPECTSASGRCVFIDSVTLDGDTYIATYGVVGFEPVIFEPGVKGQPEDRHIHFFFDTIAPANAGSNGQPPGKWELWDRDRGRGELRFDAFNTTNQADFEGTGATKLCAVVSDANHGVEGDSGNCLELP